MFFSKILKSKIKIKKITAATYTTWLGHMCYNPGPRAVPWVSGGEGGGKVVEALRETHHTQAPSIQNLPLGYKD